MTSPDLQDSKNAIAAIMQSIPAWTLWFPGMDMMEGRVYRKLKNAVHQGLGGLCMFSITSHGNMTSVY
jgi:hypothetical protein